METSSKDRLIETGMAMLLERGYNHLGIQDVLAATSLPKGSFYHHFQSKEEFALAVIDRYMAAVHEGLDASLGDQRVAPLLRVRQFFESTTEKYRDEGYLGCLLGGLGQELAGVSDVFRARIETCLSEISSRVASCLQEAIKRGELPKTTHPQELADLLVNCWEGAALRTRLLRNPGPLKAMLDFYFQAMPHAPRRKPRHKRVTGARSRP
jgi:TetR/AcrR family transcriptional regulator, transcriptional repressor for nem operon